MSFYKTLFKNTILICAAFSLFATVCISLVSYRYVKNEYAANAESDIERISNSFENSLNQVQGLSVLFQANEYIKSYVESDVPSSEDATEVWKYLHSTVSGMPNIPYRVAISKITDNKIIGNNFSSTFNYFISSYNISENEIAEMLDNFGQNRFITTATFVSSQKKSNYIIIFYSDRTSFNKDYFIISVYNLDNILFIPSNEIFSLRNYDKLIYCSDNTVTDKMDNEDFLSGYTVISKNSRYSNLLGTLTYTILIPEKQYFTLIYRFLILILPIVLLLVVISYLISKKLSKKIYKPVEQLVNQVNDISPSVVEDEFESISSTISLLTRQNAKYQDDIMKNQATLKNKFFHDLFTGFLSKEQIESGINQYLGNIDTAFPLSVIIASIPDNVSGNSITGSNDTYSLNVLIYNLFNNAFSDSDFFNFVIISPLVYGIVVSADDIPALRQKLKQIALKAESALNLNINSYIGESINSREELPSAFFSTYTSYTSNFGKDTQLVIESADMSDITMYPLELENKILSACINCQKNQLDQLLDYLFNEKIQAQDVSKNKNYYLSTLFYSTCMRVLNHLNISAEEVFGANYNIYLELRSCRSFTEIHDRLRDIFIEIIDYILNKKVSQNRQYGDDMLDFINRNYNNQDITLASLAEYMNMSQAYVSKLFKRLTNYNFKEYLTNIRIEKGTELLRDNPDMSIKEISNLVGYSNPDPFTKAFIQIHGISPSDYIRQNR